MKLEMREFCIRVFFPYFSFSLFLLSACLLLVDGTGRKRNENKKESGRMCLRKEKKEMWEEKKKIEEKVLFVVSPRVYCMLMGRGRKINENKNESGKNCPRGKR